MPAELVAAVKVLQFKFLNSLIRQQIVLSPEAEGFFIITKFLGLTFPNTVSKQYIATYSLCCPFVKKNSASFSAALQVI